MAKTLRNKLIAILFAIALLGVGFAAGEFYLNLVYQRQVEASYRRALSELGSHFQELEAELSLARVAMSLKQRNQIGSNLRRLIYAVQSNMGELPLGEISLERVCQLLDELYDQTYSYTQGALDSTAVEVLHGQIEYVNHELGKLLLDKEQEFPWVAWQEYFSASVRATQALQPLALINDGLEGLERTKQANRGEITGDPIGREQAQEAAQIFMDREDLNFQVVNESKGSIPAYSLEAMDGEERISVEVSQKGGMVLWMMVSKAVSESHLTLEEMVVKGLEFLQARDFPPLHVTDVQRLQHRTTITFVPKRGDILRYGEPLRVQVSAADGRILGFWGTSYYLGQSRLQIEAPPTEEVSWDLQAKIQAGMEILAERLALIQNAGREEVLTTRLGVQYQDAYYLIYLNRETGEEEQIVQVTSPQFF